MANYNSQLQSNNTDLQAILNTINELPECGSDPILQDKTITPTTSQQTVTADADYDGLNTVTVNAIPTAIQATPTIALDSSTGIITATATQTEGYVASGTKSASKQLAFQAAQTITPGTTNKTIAANTYLGGVQTIEGDENLVASNIVSGKSIFGVVGTATGGDDPFANSSPFTYTVNEVSGASYGFAKNSSEYYESQNKGLNNTYAICRVDLNVTRVCDIVFDVINYAESSYDYAIFSNLDSALSLSYSADSSVKQSFKGKQSASVVNVTYSGVTVGNHYIDIKFIKDSSQHSNNDSVQFKVQEQGGLSQETINKILAADVDLVASNIKSGVDIFGVIGTYEGSGGFPNGKEWTKSNTIPVDSLYYNNGIWVGCGTNSDGLYYSTDGKTWTKSNNITSDSFYDVYNANGVWVACSGKDKGLYYSTNGKTWVRSNITGANFRTVYNANGIWVTGSNSDNGLYYSTNGTTWTQSNITSGNFNGVYNANGIWVAGSNSGNGIYYSTDGKTWAQSDRTSGYFEKAYNANGIWVVGCANAGGTASTGTGLYYSLDGKSWTQSNITRATFKIVYNANGVWVAGGGMDGHENGKGIYYSTDGRTWTQSNITSGTSYSIYNANGIWVACVSSKGLYYSLDGKSWTQSNITSGYFYHVYNANGIWVASDSSYTSSSKGVYYSVTWEPTT